MSRVGDVIGQYELLEQRGSGGMGVVWEAADGAGRHVALKQMHLHLCDDAELVKRFRREYEVGVSLNHPNLVRMLAYDGEATPPYLVMELATGKSLRRLLERGGRFYEWEVAVVGAQIADAMVALHRQHVVHRDLKSSNVVIDRDLRVVIIDYGIARVEGESAMGLTQGFVGSPEYSSPEPYWSRPRDPRSDVYSAGIILFEMFAGAVPFRSDRYTDTLRMHAELPVPNILEKNALVSPEMARLVTAMLQKQPERRPSAAQVADACRAISATLGRGVRAVSAPDARAQPMAAPAARPAPRVREMEADTQRQIALIVLAIAGLLGVSLVMIMLIVAANA
jgi:serine/threonine protein kinase